MKQKKPEPEAKHTPTPPPPRNLRRWARPSIRELGLRSTRGMGSKDRPYEFEIGYAPKS